MNKKIAALGLTLGLAGGAAAGFAFAGGPSLSLAATSTETSTDATTSTSDDHAAEHAARLTEVLQPLVEDGTLTQAQLDAVVATLQDAGPMGGGRHGGGGRGANLEAAATALGTTVEELRTELQAGSTLAEVATAAGVDVQTVIDAIVAERTEHITARVADGTLTQAEADAKLAELPARVTEMVNSELPAGGRGGRGGMGHRGGDATADATTDDATTDTTGS